MFDLCNSKCADIVIQNVCAYDFIICKVNVITVISVEYMNCNVDPDASFSGKWLYDINSNYMARDISDMINCSWCKTLQ